MPALQLITAQIISAVIVRPLPRTGTIRTDGCGDKQFTVGSALVDGHLRRPTSHCNAATQKLLRFFTKHIKGDLVGGRGGHLSAGGEEVHVRRLNERGVLPQHPRRPQRACDVMPLGCKVGSEATI